MFVTHKSTTFPGIWLVKETTNPVEVLHCTNELFAKSIVIAVSGLLYCKELKINPFCGLTFTGYC